MKQILKAGTFLLWIAFAAAGWGCASTETENMADRPWNSPKSWEHGLPPSIMEGR